MSNTTPIVTVFGGSGFVGRYITHRLARAGWRVRVAVRRPNEAMHVKPYGDVGQVEPILCNVRDEASTRRAIEGEDAVVNCVGILQETKFQSFEDVHVDAANLIARLSAEAGVAKLVHISALGADPDAESEYSETKAEGEKLVLAAMPNAVIFRPSIMFGTEDRFFNRMAELSRISPVLPLVGADTKFQPVYVNDVALAVETAITGDVEGGIYELGGPDIATLRELAKMAMDGAGRHRKLLELSFGFARMQARGFEMVEKLSGGLIPAMLTRDQVKLLQVDNVVSEGAVGFAELGITPTSMESVLDSYLYFYRTRGQYTAATESDDKAN